MRTTWDSDDIWLRKSFTLDGVPTSLVLSLYDGAGGPTPDAVTVRVFERRALSYEAPALAVPAGQPGLLGTVVVYPPSSAMAKPVWSKQ